MNKLTIQTKYPDTVESLLKTYDLVLSPWLLPRTAGEVVLSYPERVLDQALVFWLDSAQTCGLIRMYDFQFHWQK
jgi:hypothetical protein